MQTHGHTHTHMLVKVDELLQSLNVENSCSVNIFCVQELNVLYCTIFFFFVQSITYSSCSCWVAFFSLLESFQPLLVGSCVHVYSLWSPFKSTFRKPDLNLSVYLASLKSSSTQGHCCLVRCTQSLHTGWCNKNNLLHCDHIPLRISETWLVIFTICFCFLWHLDVSCSRSDTETFELLVYPSQMLKLYQ